MSTATLTRCTLTGAALKAEATRLAIPGRSRMSADELRAAIDRVTATLDGIGQSIADSVFGLDDMVASVATSPLRDVPAPVQRIPAPAPVPFRTKNGKRKPSTRRIHRRSI